MTFLIIAGLIAITVVLLGTARKKKKAESANQVILPDPIEVNLAEETRPAIQEPVTIVEEKPKKKRAPRKPKVQK